MSITVCNITNLNKGNEAFYLSMMLDSALEFADEIVCVLDQPDSNSILLNKEFINQHKNKRIKFYKLNFQENFSLGRRLAQDNATSDWVLWLDADEVLHEKVTEELPKILNELAPDIDGAHVQYIHFINDFAHIDNSEPFHYGLYRLYKNFPEIKFKRETHSLPDKRWQKVVVIPNIVIFHLGYLRGMFKIRERFERNNRLGSFHLPFHQVTWRDWHYFGIYPTKLFNPEDVPAVIKKHYLMEF